MKNKMANKLLAILLSAAMAVTVLPQTSAFATEAGETGIEVEEIEVTDLSGQTGEDSADVESETEADADTWAAVSENRLDAEDTKDVDATEDDCISAETVGDGSWENPFVVKEGEETEIHIMRHNEYEDQIYFGAYISFTPSATGIYSYSFLGSNSILGERIYCDRKFHNENKIVMEKGKNYKIKFYSYENEMEECDIVIKISPEEIWNSGENITVVGSMENISLKANTAYRFIFSKPGTFHITNADSEKKNYIKMYTGDSYIDIDVDTTEGSTKIYDFDTIYDSEYLVYTEVDNTLNIAYSMDYEALTEDTYYDNIEYNEEDPTYYSFVPSETGLYYLDGFRIRASHLFSNIVSLEKGKQYFLEFVDEEDEYPIIWNMSKKAEEMVLGSNNVDKLTSSRFFYECDKDITFLFTSSKDVKADYLLKTEKGWEILGRGLDTGISCKAGDVLYVLIYNTETSEANFVAKETVYQSEEMKLSLNKENQIVSGTSKKNYYYKLPMSSEFGVFDINISNATEQTKFKLIGKNASYYKNVIKNSESEIVISNEVLNDYEYLMVYEADGATREYTVQLDEKELPKLEVGGNSLDFTNEARYYYYELSVPESGWYVLYDADDDASNYYFYSIVEKEKGDSIADCKTYDTFDEKCFLYLEKGIKYLVRFQYTDHKYHIFTVSNIKELAFDQSNWCKKTVTFKPNGREDCKLVASDTGYLISYTEGMESVSIYDYNDTSDNPQKTSLVEKGKTYRISFQGIVDNNAWNPKDINISLYIDTYTYKNDQTAAAAVVEVIKAIGIVTLEKKAAIEKARVAYNALTDNAKKCVSAADLKILTDAETKYAKLVADKAAADKAAAEKAAEEAAKKAAAEEAAKQEAVEAAKKEAVGAENVVGDATYVVAENQTVIFKAPSKKDAKSVKIPETIQINGKDFAVTEIAADAFKNNKKLTKVTMPKNIKVIGKNAFQNCSALKIVTIGSSVTTIGDGAFQGCSKLTKVTIPAKVTKIGKKAFYNCKKLKTITIKTSSLKSVGKSAFKKIAKKASIKVPKKKLTAYKKLLKGKTEADTKIKK